MRTHPAYSNPNIPLRKTLTTKVDVKLINTLRDLAKEQGITTTELVREILKEYLK